MVTGFVDWDKERQFREQLIREAFMPQFKVGDSVRVIGQRVCPSNGNVPIGATGKIFNITGTEYLVKFDPKIPSGELHAGFMADSLELCHDRKFKVGDAVRMKAGSPVWESYPDELKESQMPHDYAIGCKGIIHQTYIDLATVDFGDVRDLIGQRYLEPWNDAEEWNGTAWVAKETNEPKQAIVGKRYNSIFDFYESTNAAVRHAERLAAASPGEEFVVYQEKASFKVEKPIRKIGSQWRVCWRQDLDDHPYFANGTIVTLIHDDGSSSPMFSGPGKDNGEMRSACVEMKRLEPV